MTDFEITKLCAEAMFDALEWEQMLFNYDPLHDDAQAMALVKKYRLAISWNHMASEPRWDVFIGLDEAGLLRRLGIAVSGKQSRGAFNEDLNRAICGCMAKAMQEKK